MEFWQSFEPGSGTEGPFADRYPAAMPDGSRLVLPLRDYGDVAVTGFIANQASIPVAKRIALWMAEAAQPFGAEVVVGVPTLGQTFAPLVADALGHTNWVALGWSRKRWYEEALSVPASSSTAPGERRLWLDPRLLDRLAGRRVLVVDDVISTGTSALAALALLGHVQVRPLALVVAMTQGDRWRAAWPADVPLRAAFATPLFARVPGGWMPRPETAPLDLCPLMSRRDAA
ncbi:phosphoribosyltransferase [Roseomonas eburnea]|uniref:Phosphoribosyltransferase n=1 Tax=Neoroseomonas eburnea TaxID=1346889 RepID=A0A9X9XA37_9PROT|nr:phosphoribosyltransferase [Neoroseomonas eburnea]MBR0680573.1 phosphoribosyltransferase [Neoroseomonas eburnea]